MKELIKFILGSLEFAFIILLFIAVFQTEDPFQKLTCLSLAFLIAQRVASDQIKANEN